MTLESRVHGHVNKLRNSATALGTAGFGFVASRSWTRSRVFAESMRDANDTLFRDTITIVGQPEWWLPIGFATFLCEVSGIFSQEKPGSTSRGDAQVEASFTGQAITGPTTDQDSWRFPSMHGPQHNSIHRILSVKVMFLIGAPIYIRSQLLTRSRERSPLPVYSDLRATTSLSTALRPIIVEGVTDPVSITLTNSGTKYYAEGEPDADAVQLRSTVLKLAHV